MDAQIQAWINGLPLSDAAKQALLAEDGFEQVYKDNVLTRSDYSRKMDELSKAKADVETERQKVTDLMAQNTQWKTGEESRLTDALRRAQAAETRLFNVQQKLRDEYDAYPETLKNLGLDGEVITKPDTSPLQDSKQVNYLTNEDFDKRANEQGMTFMSIQNQLFKVGKQHRKLFGSDDDYDPDDLLKFALDNKLSSIESAWEQKYNVSAKREEIRQAEVKRQIAEAVTLAKSQWESELALQRQSGPKLPGAVIDPDRQQFQRVVESTSTTSNAQGSQAAKQARIARASAMFDQVLDESGKGVRVGI